MVSSIRYRARAAVAADQDRLVHQRSHQVQHLVGGQPGHRRRPPRPPPARTRRRTPPAGRTASARPGCSSVVAPVHRGPQRLLPRRRGPAAPGQQPEAGRPAGRRSAPRSAPRTRAAASSMASGMPSSRRQIPATAARVRRRSARSPARACAGPLDEQPHRLGTAPAPPRVGGRPAVRHGQRRAPASAVSPATPAAPGWWPGPAARAAARSSASASRRTASSRCSQLSSTSSSCAPASDSASVAAGACPARSCSAQRHGDRLGHQRRVGAAGQLDQPHAVRERPAQPAAARAPGGSCRPRRPRSASPAGLAAAAADLGQLPRAADEAGQLGGQVPGHARPRCHDNLAAGISRRGTGAGAAAECSRASSCRCSLLRQDYMRLRSRPQRSDRARQVPGRCPGRRTSARAADLRLNHAAARRGVPRPGRQARPRHDPYHQVAAHSCRSAGL